MSVLDPAKLAVILVVALVVLGPERMQLTARHLGSLWRTVGEHRARIESGVHEALGGVDLPSPSALRPTETFHRAFAELTSSLQPKGRSADADAPGTLDAEEAAIPSGDLDHRVIAIGDDPSMN